MIIPSCIGLVGGSGMNDDTLEKSASGVRGNYDSDDVDDDVDDEWENYDLCSAFGISDYGSYENDDDDDDDHDGNYNDIDNGFNNVLMVIVALTFSLSHCHLVARDWPSLSLTF